MHRSTLCLSLALLCLAGCASFPVQIPPAGADTQPEASARPIQADLAAEFNKPPEPASASTDSTAASPTDSEDDAPAEYADIWERIRSGFALDHETDRSRVMTELKWYVNHPEYVERVTRRATPYLHYIVSEIEARGLPMEFALLPIVESAYDPFAYSHGRAAGLWQFIPGTARVYDLRIDWWYDGRRDVREATRAAIDYLEYLHGMFNGDWLLALAAYNAGQGNVLQSIRASRKSTDQVDFWHLNVFRETYTYVPRLLAISELIANPDRYHMQLPGIKNEPQWEVVDIGSQLDLHKAARLAGVPPEDIYKLNPGFNQWATHPDGPHELLIPLDKVEAFRTQLAMLPDTERVGWVRHKIRTGESLGSIASRYRTTINTIRVANNIRGNMIRAGDSLLIPAASREVDYRMTSEGRLAAKQATLEANYGGEPVIYTVQPGDSFWEISRKYKVGMRELARWNGMGTTGLLHPGTELKIFNTQFASNADTGGATLMPVAKRNAQVRKINYRVRNGESLSRIAQKFNVTVENIRNWNESIALKKYIHPGDKLTIYVDVTSQIN